LEILGSQELPVEVELVLDEERRRFNARLHSAGHLLDVAVRNLGLVFYLLFIIVFTIFRILSPIKVIISRMDLM
jgi:hypothetical protein